MSFLPGPVTNLTSNASTIGQRTSSEDTPLITAYFKWCPRPDLNRDTRFRKPLLYPVELREQLVINALEVIDLVKHGVTRVDPA